jgi:Asp-tRNA(Asn)/Glu-tRNA(Gln) amidotransferase A subunit family amidase
LAVATVSEELKRCLTAIEESEKRVQAWTFVDRKRAVEEASRLDRDPPAPLHGVIVGVKDIIDVAEMPTGCGSARWKNSIAREDAQVIKKLRESGALILGKTVTTPFAYLDPSVTRNPWNAERTPGGSSAGSAAAVAYGACTVALGSQTGGSTIRPASYCGIASLKPTYGSISTQGVWPLAPSLDHIGLMANTVRELALVFQVIAGPDGGGGRHWFGTANHAPIPDCLQLIEANQAAPLVPITRLTGLFEEKATPEILKLYQAAIRKLEEEWHPLPTAIPPSGFHTVHQHHMTLMSSEAAQVHEERFHRHPEDYPPKISELVQTGAFVKGVDLAKALTHQQGLCVEIERMLKTAGIFVTPATPDLPPTRETTGSPAFNSPWSFLGFPVVSVPAGWSENGLPFALQFIGPPNSEAALLAVANWAESVLRFERRELPK